jgi:heptosyltransferase-2
MRKIRMIRKNDEPDSPPAAAKPRLLVVELWGLGDLVIASPFLQAASRKFAVTLLAKPYAEDLQARFWPGVRVIPFIAPWTAFKHKYRLLAWPWGEIFRLWRSLSRERFDFGLSARWDPRDHFMLRLVNARTRLGFPRLRSQIFLTRPLPRPLPEAHRYEHWRVIADALGIELPEREKILLPHPPAHREILVHTGAGQPVRVWPLQRYQQLIAQLRAGNYRVQVACDPDQEHWWRAAGETNLAVPHTVGELLALSDRAGAFVGNDSGPGHLAAFSGVPTFTLFGPQLSEWFAPLNPASDWLEGKACPYKPCSDYCRFPVPCCTMNSSEEEVQTRVTEFLNRVFPEGHRTAAVT